MRDGGPGTAVVAIAGALVLLVVVASLPAHGQALSETERVEAKHASAPAPGAGHPPGAGYFPETAGAPGAVGNETNASATEETATEAPGSAEFEVSGLDDLVVPVGGADALRPWNGTVTVTVENTGDRRGATWVEIRLVSTPTGGVSRPTDRERVTLDPGERRAVSLQPLGVISGGPGNYTVLVRTNESTDNLTGTIAVHFPRYAHFEIDDVASRGFDEGTGGTMVVTVENIGRPPGVDPGLSSSQGPAVVAVSVNGVVVAETRVWLDVDESRTVSLPVSLSAFAPGQNRVAVRTHSVGNRSAHDEVAFTVSNGSGRTTGADGPGFGPVAAVVGALLGVGAWLTRRR